MNNPYPNTEEIYLAGGCLWGVQEFVRYLPGVIKTEAGRANGTTNTTKGEYDGYAECVRTVFDPTQVSVPRLVEYLFEIIDPYSINQQGPDLGKKYRTGVYSKTEDHLNEARQWIACREDADRIAM
ncbi:MAG: peptide-methionine (S)-S-oxide reductase, partial [Opitutae bacterium]